MKPAHSISYRPEIDGLRALAVMSVILFHFGVGCPGGYVGVDIFFVISGFLITGHVKRSLETDTFCIRDFYERRARRILPALFFVMAITGIAGWVILLPTDFLNLGSGMAAQTLFVSNVLFWRQSGYFATAAELNPLLHLWSLSVEEQYYVVSPLALLLLHRMKNPGAVKILCGVALASFLLSVYGSYRHPSANFFLLPSRVWEFLAGGLLCCLPKTFTDLPKLFRESLSFAGLLAVLTAVFFFKAETRLPGFAALLPCLGAAGFIQANTKRLTLAGRLMGFRPIAFIGVISYSLYLWHWPIIVFNRHWQLNWNSDLDSRSSVGLLLVATFLASVLSWWGIERPFRRSPAWRKPRILYPCVAAAHALFLTAGISLRSSFGFPGRISPEVKGYIETTKEKVWVYELSPGDVRADSLPLIGNPPDKKPKALIWGDSHAMAILPLVDKICQEEQISCAVAVHSSTAPVVGYQSLGRHSLGLQSVEFNHEVIEYVRRHRIKTVLMAAVWGSYRETQGPGNLREGLVATIDFLTMHGIKVVVMRQVPPHRWDVPRKLAALARSDMDVAQVGRPVEELSNLRVSEESLLQGLNDRNGVIIIDPWDAFVDENGIALVTRGGKALYRDNHHLSILGAMQLDSLIRQHLKY